MSNSPRKHISKSNFPTKTDFLEKYGISEETFKAADITWYKLKEIYDDYSGIVEQLEKNAQIIVSALLSRKAKDAGVHSVRSRVKSPEGLIEKIIRKRSKDTNRDINLENYREEITDLIGVRALHVFKHDWYNIHHLVLEMWDCKCDEQPTAYFREGDSERLTREYENVGCKAEVHPKGYRSIHYILEFSPTKEKCHAELQVRTVFEEGWSEIDHKLRYSFKSDNEHPLEGHLAVLNRIAGSADEMGMLVRELEAEMQEKLYESTDVEREETKNRKNDA